jgi:hypothetical protein
MDWRQGFRQLNNSLQQTIIYSDQFGYPLTPEQLWFWQLSTRISASSIKKQLPSNSNYFYFSGHKRYINQRLQREKYSRRKMVIATRVGDWLRRFPTISAVFVTGALAMDNCPVFDDIDLMIVTLPQTLWITRSVVDSLLLLHGWRRDFHLPEHSSTRVNDKICDNLWLDSAHLSIQPPTSYLAHEVLQARCLWDRRGIHRLFLEKNVWAARFLPIAYSHLLAKVSPSSSATFWWTWLVAPFNLVFFIIQYLHMRPHISSEKVGIGFAFFHPRPQNR